MDEYRQTRTRNITLTQHKKLDNYIIYDYYITIIILYYLAFITYLKNLHMTCKQQKLWTVLKKKGRDDFISYSIEIIYTGKETLSIF